MANPSDTGPSGVGTETLRRRYVDGTGESEVTLCAGVANHIMTIVSIIICEVEGRTDAVFHLYIDYDLGGSNLYLLSNQSLNSLNTFIWNDKIVLTDTDKLHMIAESAASTAGYDVWVTYIDQEFTT
tara:strand:+ start:70 stop:450 length:381 start_codon:yes stop_codon:yes gene_type:complete